jgi:ubiquitin-conjugating enzyme E2 variant
MVDQDEKFFKSSRRQDSVSSRLTTQTLSLPKFQWIGYFLCCYLAADLLAGFWHWWEDRYADVRWPLVGDWIAKPNELHHDQPLAFLDQGYWSRNSTTIIPAVIAFLLTVPHPICGVFVFVSQANEIHAWAHSKGKVASWIEVFQSIGLFQSPKHHAQHHIDPFESKYCVMTDLLNPLLDRLDFWRRLEWIVERTIGVVPHK